MPDTSLTFVLGGARSGKSAFAEGLIETLPAPWSYVATSQVFDDEMRERIGKHQQRRSGDWQTVEAPLDLASSLAAMPDGHPVLVDCLTLWLTNHMLAESDLEREFDRLLSVLAKPRGPWVIVSNEVGHGIVPDNALARRFRDEAGRLHQRVAAIANRVVFVVAGLPMELKA